MNDLFCDFDAPVFWIFSENVLSLLYYSHFTAIITAVLIGTLLLFRKQQNGESVSLIALLFIFSVWSFVDIILWATNSVPLVLFLWSMQIFFEPAMYLIAVCLFYIYTERKMPSFQMNLVLSVLLLPLVILLPTYFTLYEINLFDCVASEGTWSVMYSYFLELCAILTILILLIRSFAQKKKIADRKKNMLFAIGLVLFLATFTSGNIIGSVTGNWDLAQYGLFGMPIFVAFLAYLIVQYRIYNLNVIGAQALIVSLWFLIGSLLFVAQSLPTRLVALFTLLASVILGFMLVRSIKQVVKQKEEIEKLAIKLEKVNGRLKVLDKMKSEFVSIASHQLRSPLTSIRGYASMLLEGSYGTLPQKARDAVERISESSRFMASSVEDYLNVSRIQAGNMKYVYTDFNLKDLAERVADDTRQIAIKKGLLLTFKSDVVKRGIVHADVGKTRQVIDNLLNNALKYTPKGVITLFVHDNPKKKKIFVEIIDTGIGMSPQVVDDMFEKFERAENANAVNVTGTGLGLYIARKIAREMGGEVTAASEGEGKGSTFTLELPLQM
jgi:signal transduction histidine kinase